MSSTTASTFVRLATRTTRRAPPISRRTIFQQPHYATFPMSSRHPAIFRPIFQRSFASEGSSTSPALTPATSSSSFTSSSSSQSSQSTEPVPRASWRPAPHRDPNEPVYELYFTCRVCSTRSGHTVSKQGYHKGTVLIQCDGCKNRHLISDHLRIFSDKSVTIEDLVKEAGGEVTKGLADGKGDMEFWEESATKGGKPKDEGE